MGLIYYGNYCGPYYTGNEFTLFGGGNYTTEPKDAIDDACRTHDESYGQAEGKKGTYYQLIAHRALTNPRF